MKFPKYNFKKIPPQNSSYARDRTLCVYNLVFLGLSMWAQHFKLKHHDSNHNPQTCKGNSLRDYPYHQATTLRWYNQVRDT